MSLLQHGTDDFNVINAVVSVIRSPAHHKTHRIPELLERPR